MSALNVGRVVIICLVVVTYCANPAQAASAEDTSRAIWLVDDFEDGNLWDTWTDNGGSCTSYITSTPAPPCPQGSNCLLISGDCGGFYEGISTDLGGFQATSLSMYIRSDTIATANAYVVIDDDNDPMNGAVVFFFGNGLAEWRFSSGGLPYICGPRVAYQWYQLAFNFDWTARTVDVSIDGNLKHADIPMASSTATGLNYLYLFNYESGNALYDYIIASSPPPEPPIFVDGFESGGTSLWSLSVPDP